MNATISDSAALEELTPANLAAYLRMRNWHRVAHEEARYSVYVPPEGEPVEALLPLRSSFGDYANRVAELIDLIARTENRSQISIFREIRHAGVDIHRFRVCGPVASLGSMPFEEGVEFVLATREMLLAAASATAEPGKPYFGGKRSTEVFDFMARTRLGQTEEGSFVVTAEVPMLPRLQAEMFPDSVVAVEPFERRVGVNLIRSLKMVREAALESQESGHLEPFKEALQKGATVNLFSSVVHAQERARAELVEISCAWALLRPPEAADAELLPVCFELGLVPTIREAAEQLRQIHSEEKVRLVGQVTLLSREEQETLFGRIRITGYINGGGPKRRVLATLHGPQHEEAIAAYRDSKPVSLAGTLVRRGKHWQLEDPYDFQTLDLQGEEGDPGDSI